MHVKIITVNMVLIDQGRFKTNLNSYIWSSGYKALVTVTEKYLPVAISANLVESFFIIDRTVH